MKKTLLVALLLAANAAHASGVRIASTMVPFHSLLGDLTAGTGSTVALLNDNPADLHGVVLTPSKVRILQEADLVLAFSPYEADFLEPEKLHDLRGENTSVIYALNEMPASKLQQIECHDHHEDDDHDDHDAHHDEDDDHDHHDDHDEHDDDHHDDDHDDHDDHDDDHHDDDHDDHDDDHHDDDHDEHDDHDDHHDDHRETDASCLDEHIWLAPQLTADLMAVIAAELSRLDPAQASTYQANLAGIKEQIDALDARLEQRRQQAGSDFDYAVLHNAYRYFFSSQGKSGYHDAGFGHVHGNLVSGQRLVYLRRYLATVYNPCVVYGSAEGRDEFLPAIGDIAEMAQHAVVPPYSTDFSQSYYEYIEETITALLECRDVN